MQRLRHQMVIGSAKEEEDGGRVIGSGGEECSLALSTIVGPDVKSVVMSTSGQSLQDWDVSVEGHFLQMFGGCEHSCLSIDTEVALQIFFSLHTFPMVPQILHSENVLEVFLPQET